MLSNSTQTSLSPRRAFSKTFYAYDPVTAKPLFQETNQETLAQDNFTTISDFSSVSTGDFKTPNPHTYRVRTAKSMQGTEEIRDNGFVGNVNIVSGNIDLGVAGSPVPELMNNTAAFNNALAKLYEQQRGNLDLSIDAVQSRQTARLIRGIDALSIYENARRSTPVLVRSRRGRIYRRWDEVSRVNPLKVLGPIWLTYVYGIKPLVQTIYDAATEVLNTNLGPSHNLVTCSGFAKDSDQGSSSSRYGDSLGFTRRTVLEQNCKVNIRARYLTKGGSDISRWTSLNPASIIYESIPFSFVLDWAYDVGSYLRSMESALLSGKTFQSGYVTFTSFAQANYVENGDFVDSFGARRYLYKEGSASQLFFNRVILTAPPLPRPPVLKLDLGSSRLLSLASLLTLGLGRKT